MATTNIKKRTEGYGYKYTDLAEIHNYLEQQGIKYYQFTEPIGDVDYIMTVFTAEEGTVTSLPLDKPLRGCRIPQGAQALSGKSNEIQNYGSIITYCRRYSLLMCAGLATTDNDANLLPVEEPTDEEKLKSDLEVEIIKLTIEKNIPIEEVLKRAEVEKATDMEIPQMCSCISALEKSPKRG